jgi:hypothetical protein
VRLEVMPLLEELPGHCFLHLPRLADELGREPLPDST